MIKYPREIAPNKKHKIQKETKSRTNIVKFRIQLRSLEEGYYIYNNNLFEYIFFILKSIKYNGDTKISNDLNVNN